MKAGEVVWLLDFYSISKTTTSSDDQGGTWDMSNNNFAASKSILENISRLKNKKNFLLFPVFITKIPHTGDKAYLDRCG